MHRLTLSFFLLFLAACVGPSSEGASAYETRVLHAGSVAFQAPLRSADLEQAILPWARAEGLDAVMTESPGACDCGRFLVRWQKLDTDRGLEVTLSRLYGEAGAASTDELEKRAQSLVQVLRRGSSAP